MDQIAIMIEASHYRYLQNWRASVDLAARLTGGRASIDFVNWTAIIIVNDMNHWSEHSIWLFAILHEFKTFSLVTVERCIPDPGPGTYSAISHDNIRLISVQATSRPDARQRLAEAIARHPSGVMWLESWNSSGRRLLFDNQDRL